jgi:hypothetical protein
MKYSVFYRTYRGDFQWLKYSLASLKKYLAGYSEIVIVTPKADYDLLKEEMKGWDLPKGIVTFRDVLEPLKDDYLGQQLCKLKAYEYVSFPYVLFVDSDAIFITPTTVEDFLRDGKPCILKTSYSSLEGDVLNWKPITEKALGEPVEFEYMRRLPLFYRRDSIKNLSWYFMEKHGVSLEDYVRSLSDRSFSEFNLLGAYIEFKKSECKNYYFLDTAKEELPEKVVKQYWSWGRLTPEIENEIKSFIND